MLRNQTSKDLGYTVSNKIFINENLTERRKEMFRDRLKVKKELHYSYIWTSNGRIYLQKDQNTPVVHINNKEDIQKLISS